VVALIEAGTTTGTFERTGSVILLFASESLLIFSSFSALTSHSILSTAEGDFCSGVAGRSCDKFGIAGSTAPTGGVAMTFLSIGPRLFNALPDFAMGPSGGKSEAIGNPGGGAIVLVVGCGVVDDGLESPKIC
jgi:hypothetical protein